MADDIKLILDLEDGAASYLISGPTEHGHHVFYVKDGELCRDVTEDGRTTKVRLPADMLMRLLRLRGILKQELESIYVCQKCGDYELAQHLDAEFECEKCKGPVVPRRLCELALLRDANSPEERKRQRGLAVAWTFVGLMTGWFLHMTLVDVARYGVQSGWW